MSVSCFALAAVNLFPPLCFSIFSLSHSFAIPLSPVFLLLLPSLRSWLGGFDQLARSGPGILRPCRFFFYFFLFLVASLFFYLQAFFLPPFPPSLPPPPPPPPPPPSSSSFRPAGARWARRCARRCGGARRGARPAAGCRPPCAPRGRRPPR